MRITEHADQIYQVVFSYKIKPKYLILYLEIKVVFIFTLFIFITVLFYY